MPAKYIVDSVRESLSSLNFKKNSGDKYVPTSSDMLKNLLISGLNVDISVLSTMQFEAKVTSDVYFRAIKSGFHFSYIKVMRQLDSLQYLLLNDDLPKAWMLVTAYYSSFYSSIEMSRLVGEQQIFLSKDHLESINNYNDTSIRLGSSGNYLGRTSTPDAQGNIIIHFSKNGDKPHDLTWRKVSSMFKNGDISKVTNPDRNRRLMKFKEIVDSSNTHWDLPNNIRNDWNYSKFDGYTKSSDNQFKMFKRLLLDADKNVCFGWGSDPKLKPTNENILASIGYICFIQWQAMEDIKPMLI